MILIKKIIQKQKINKKNQIIFSQEIWDQQQTITIILIILQKKAKVNY